MQSALLAVWLVYLSNGIELVLMHEGSELHLGVVGDIVDPLSYGEFRSPADVRKLK